MRPKRKTGKAEPYFDTGGEKTSVGYKRAVVGVGGLRLGWDVMRGNQPKGKQWNE